MNYLPKNRTRSPRSKRILLALAVFVLSAVVFYFLGGLVVRLAVPVWQTENALARSLQGVTDFFTSRKSLSDENVELRARVESLETEISSLYLGEEREMVLLELLDRRPSGPTVTASVLTHPPQSPYDVLIIDAGSSQGVNIGDRVYLPEGPVLGTVFEIFPRTARVRLYSSSGEMTGAVLERGGVPVTMEGQGAGNFKIILPRDIEAERGDRVLSADITADLLAVIEDIRLEPTDSFKEILAKSPTNIFGIRFVFVRP
ncbi:MAG: rod shape-determining protein MreC [Parcubacteria group bacterium]